MKKRTIYLISLAALTMLLAVAVSACGGDSSDEKASDSTAAPAGSTGSGPDLGAIEVDSAAQGLLPDEIKSSGELKTATAAPFPPFIMFESPGSSEMVGLDADIADAVGAKLGTRIVWSNSSLDGIVPGLLAGKYDFAIGSITDTKERQQQVDFVDYLRNANAFLVKAGNPDGVETLTDVCGKSVAVEAGSTFESFLNGDVKKLCNKDGQPPVKVLPFPKDSDAQLALSSGKASAKLTNMAVAAYTASESNGQFELVEDPNYPTGYLPAMVGMAVAKDHKQLLKALEAATRSLMDDGTYDEILDRWGVGSAALEEPGINQGEV